MTHGIDWTHTPSKSDLEYDSQRPEKFRLWKKFQYIATAQRFGTVVYTEVITVYTRTEHVFQTIIKNWNFLGNIPMQLNPGLTWHYAPASE